MDLSETKGVVLIKDENGKESIQTKYIYLRMKHSRPKIELIAEAPTYEELKKKSGRR